MKIEFDIFNREFFRTLTFSLKIQKKAQVSIIYMKNIVFLLPACKMKLRIIFLLHNTSSSRLKLFKLLKLFHKPVVLLCDILMLYL